MRVRTRAAILTATASALAADRLATLPDIAASAGVSRTTLHRYFADGETLVDEATLGSIRILAETVDEAASSRAADRVLFLFADRATLQNTPTELER